LTTIASLITYTVPGIVDCLVPIPRLVEKFKVSPYNMQPFCAVIEGDDECKRLQALINQGISHVLGFSLSNTIHISSDLGGEMWDV